MDELLQFRRSANAADEIDPLAGALVVDAENRIEHVFLKQGDVELFNRIGCFDEVRTEIEGVPLAVDEKTKFVFARRRCCSAGGTNW